jgi:uncharacterized FlgJ-related protein
MKTKTILLFLFLLGFGILSAQRQSTEQYIEKYKLIAIDEMLEYHIPASITLAQGILESGSGNSRLAVQGNNHFGIKCHSDWNGQRIYEDDDKNHECFRKYTEAEDSYRDHSLFLSRKSRYAFLFDLKTTDYKAWAKGLKKAGYATNPHYPKRLIDLIQRYNLDQYDKVSKKELEKMIKQAKSDKNNQSIIPEKYRDRKKEAEPGPAVTTTATKPQAAGHSRYHEVNYHNRIKYIVYRQGDSPEKICAEFDLWCKQFYKFNDLKPGQKIQAGTIIYLQPKRRKGDVKYHVVKGGESLWEIAQQHGIQLKWLLKRNHLNEKSKLRRGQQLWLRDTRPENSASF